MPLVSDLLGFVQSKLDMSGPLTVIRTLHMIAWLCNYIKPLMQLQLLESIC